MDPCRTGAATPLSATQGCERGTDAKAAISTPLLWDLLQRRAVLQARQTEIRSKLNTIEMMLYALRD